MSSNNKCTKASDKCSQYRSARKRHACSSVDEQSSAFETDVGGIVDDKGMPEQGTSNDNDSDESWNENVHQRNQAAVMTKKYAVTRSKSTGHKRKKTESEQAPLVVDNVARMAECGSSNNTDSDGSGSKIVSCCITTVVKAKKILLLVN